MKKMLSMLAGAVLLLAACNKEKVKDVNKENLVGTYKVTAMQSQMEGLPPEDELESMEPCEKDDLLKLNADMTCNAVDAGTRCDPPGDENGTWALPASNQITMHGETQTIKSFDGRTLVLEFKLDIFGVKVTTTTTLVKQ